MEFLKYGRHNLIIDISDDDKRCKITDERGIWKAEFDLSDDEYCSTASTNAASTQKP